MSYYDELFDRIEAAEARERAAKLAAEEKEHLALYHAETLRLMLAEVPTRWVHEPASREEAAFAMNTLVNMLDVVRERCPELLTEGE